MQYRDFGKTGIQVSEIGHGTWAMGSMWGARDDENAKRALVHGLELGIHFIDTAWAYGNGHAEFLIGEVLRETGFKPFVATKCPPKNLCWPGKGSVAETFPADHLIAMTEKSLSQLGLDCVDLQQLHVWQDQWLEDGDWLGAVDRLKNQGKIQFFGISINDHQADSALKAVSSGLIDSVQVIFNLFDQRPRERLFPLCQEKQVAVIVRVPLDEGGLSGQLRSDTVFSKGDWRRMYFKGDRLQETIEKADQFKFLMRGDIKTLAQAALKFCLSEKAVSTVIPGMRSLKHVEDNAAVSDMKGFSEEELAKVYTLAWPRNFYPSYG